MKKIMINDTLGFGILTFMILGSSSLILLCWNYENPQQNMVAARWIISVIFGLEILCCLWLLLRTEIIIITKKEICCLNIKGKTEIAILNITEISEIRKFTYGIDNWEYEQWKISDSKGNSVCIVKTQRRKKIIEGIQHIENSDTFGEG